jgi:hypothetical protein
MRVILGFNNNTYTAVVFSEIEKAFEKTWQLGLLYKLLELKFSISLIKIITPVLSEKIHYSAEVELFAPSSVTRLRLSRTFYSLYIEDTNQKFGLYLGPFADETYKYATDRKEIYSNLLQLHPRRREVSSSVIPLLLPCEGRTGRMKSTTKSKESLWEDVLL